MAEDAQAVGSGDAGVADGDRVATKRAATGKENVGWRWLHWALLGTIGGVVLGGIAVWTLYVFWGAHRLLFVFTARWSALVALAIPTLGVLAVQLALRLRPGAPARPSASWLDRPASVVSKREKAAKVLAFRRDGLKGVVVGGDGRTSTSKVQVALWTYALLFGLLMLLLVGRSPNCPATHGKQPGQHSLGSCPTASHAAFTDALGTSFRWEYLLLLGLPITAAVAAKQQVLNALDQLGGTAGQAGQAVAGSPQAAGTPGLEVKSPPTSADAIGVTAGLRDIVADDRGQGALLDAQYFAFTLLGIAYFAVQLTTHPTAGLPAIPAGLLVLMGLSGAGYLSNKAIDPLGDRASRGTTT
jgi:hypothetical protein